ncbi:MAG: hypothetical protein BGO76_06835 [Caedibacter sp. 38-128]|nr:hypothetical protein [Holosporales bacterium]OJX03848.1 MAG: hypothetical protein BGO76_06835 [Caedibacter sp. 38-128]
MAIEESLVRLMNVRITINKDKKTIGGKNDKKTIGGKNDKKINKGTKDESRYKGDEKPLFFTKYGGSVLDPCGRTDYL